MSKLRRRRNNINAKGRTKYDESQYLGLTHKMIKSPQFRSLGGNDVRVLIEIASRHNGYNNGRIGAGLVDLADVLMMGKSTVQNSLKNLQKTKFIKLRKPGKFQGRIASEWEITFLVSGGLPASNEWGQAKSLSYKRKPKPKTLIQEISEETENQKLEKIESGT